MISILKKVGLYFAKKIHISKIKVLLTVPLFIAILTSMAVNLDWKNENFKYTKDSSTFNEFLTISILVFFLILLDIIYEFLDSKRKERTKELDAEILGNPLISDELKKQYLSKE